MGANAGFTADPLVTPASSLPTPLMISVVPGAPRASVNAVETEAEASETETVGASATLNAPAVTGNDAETAFGGTVTEAGAVNKAELLETERTVPPAGAALANVAVQFVPVFGVRVETAHFSEVIAGEEDSGPDDNDSDVTAEVRFSDAVMVAV